MDENANTHVRAVECEEPLAQAVISEDLAVLDANDVIDALGPELVEGGSLRG